MRRMRVLPLGRWVLCVGCTALLSGSVVTMGPQASAEARTGTPAATLPRFEGDARREALNDRSVGGSASRSDQVDGPEPATATPGDGPSRQPLQRGSRRDSAWGAAYRQIPVPKHARIASYLDYLSGTAAGRRMWSEWVVRARRHASMIWRTLDEHGLPRELMGVALIESGLQTDAVSPAGATGMWQFVADTARHYGLAVTSSLDERRDPERATEAAVLYLRELHSRYKDWAMAFAAYNAGELRMDELATEVGSNDFWVISELSDRLPEETRDYVPKVFAAVTLLSSPKVYGFATLEPQPEPDLVRLPMAPGTPLETVARALGLELRDLRQLNPALRGDLVTGSVGAVAVPADRERVARLLFDDSAQTSDLATAKRVSLLPSRKFSLAKARCFPAGCSFPSDVGGWERLQRALDEVPHRTYRVRQGDSLFRVSKLLGVEVERLRRENGVSDPTALQVGQLLRVAGGLELPL